MSCFLRLVIVALLSLAVPLQVSFAYARAVGMTAGKATLGATARVGMSVAVISAAKPKDALAEHASSAEHHHHYRSLSAEPGKLAMKATGHPASHLTSGNACDSSAKCCLAGAAAPPLIWPQSADVVASRVHFSASSDTSSCFIPDGPERPPRCL